MASLPGVYCRTPKVPFWAGISGLLVSRVLEAFIPLFLRDGIDAVAAALSGGAAGGSDDDCVGARRDWYVRRAALRLPSVLAPRNPTIGVYVAYDLATASTTTSSARVRSSSRATGRAT
jgi:hypothetical protein